MNVPKEYSISLVESFCNISTDLHRFDRVLNKASQNEAV